MLRVRRKSQLAFEGCAGWPGRALLGVVAVWLVAAGPGPAAKAQDLPDARDIRPVVMLLADTSGSMERLPSCVCSTPGCEECYPSCTGTSSDERNRWATVLEALTGEWSTFSCDRQQRVGGGYSGEYDYRYPIPHFAPPIASAQLDDGILDAYMERTKFGLMTFDGQPTFDDTSMLLPQRIFETRLADNNSDDGMFSYAQRKAFTFPNCGEPFMVDNGARNESASVGQLISVGDDAADHRLINARIQDALLAVRPFGGTPIAGLLDDFRYYLNNHPDVAPSTTPGVGDPFAACRSRYAVMLTDGAPNNDMREYGCDTAGHTCPYELPEEIAADLCRYSPSSDACTGDVDGLYVVGFDINDPEAVATLNEIANMGGTEAALFATDKETLMQKLGEALDAAAPGTTTRTVPAFAGSGAGLPGQRQAQLNTGFNQGLVAGEPWEGVLERRRFECNANLEPEPQPVSTADGDRFQEVLDAQTTSPIASTFGACPSSAPRCLLTVVPNNAANATGHLGGSGCTPQQGGGEQCFNPLLPVGDISDNGGTIRPAGPGGAPPLCGGSGTVAGSQRAPVETNLELQPFDSSNSAITTSMLGVADATERDALFAWMHGLAGTARDGRRLGDIYHSSPIIVGPPPQDLPDESFNLFRQRDEVSSRPVVAYVGSNDGILHAFAVDDFSITSGPHAGTTLEAGEELWGFVPPMFLAKLQSAMSAHQFMVDGTPVVREVFVSRTPGQQSSPDQYRTVLVVGMRSGGTGYVALDVTDPLAPRFLWQFTDPNMGSSFGRAAVGQLLVEGSDGLQERAIALIPGGTGEDLTAPASGCGSGLDTDGDGIIDTDFGCVPQGKGPPSVSNGTTDVRDQYRCWDVQGRQLHFVDVITGQRIGVLGDQTFNAPLTGGVSLFSGEVGTIATRAFVTDHEGVVWMVDFAGPDPTTWSAEPLHDIFWDGSITSGQPAFFAPVISTDDSGHVVILQGTGDIDVLDSGDINKVVSITENLVLTDSGSTSGLAATLNWEIPLDPGEQVTGPLELFEGKVYFGSFLSLTDPTNACAFGSSKLWGVEYLMAETTAGLPIGALPDPSDGEDVVRFQGPFDNQIVMGVSVAQRPTCVDLVDAEVTDPYVGTRTTKRIGASGGGQFELVALVGGDGVNKSGSAVKELDAPALPQPQQFTRMQSFVGSIE